MDMWTIVTIFTNQRQAYFDRHSGPVSLDTSGCAFMIALRRAACGWWLSSQKSSLFFTAAVDEPPLPMRRHRVKRRKGIGACQGRLALSKGWKSVSISFLYTSVSDISHFPRARNST